MNKKKLDTGDRVQIGYWRSSSETNLPIPVENTCRLTDQERQKVINYLDGGEVVKRYKGSSICRICMCRNGSTDISDGEYIWPSGLVHYVRDHKVRIPVYFTDKILGNNPKERK